MPILDLQKRARELGRIRTGNKGDRGQPQKLERFRLTSSSRELLEKVAELYGGEVQRWENGKLPQWEVYTTSTRLPILVPPQPLTQWYEVWTAGGCQHRCDGEFDQISGMPCDQESRLHLEAKARPTTRLNVVLRDVEGMGVWRLESHGYNAAVELPEVAQFLAQAGGYVDGYLALEPRKTTRPGPDGKPQTRNFIVPVIDVAVTPAELLAGRGTIRPPEVEGPISAPALEAGAGDAVHWQELLSSATTTEELRAVWRQASHAGQLTPELEQALQARAHELPADEDDETQRMEEEHEGMRDEVVDAEIVDPPEEGDTDAAYQLCVAAAGQLGITLWAMESQFEQGAGMPMGDASAAQLTQFAQYLTTQHQEKDGSA